MFKRSIRIRTSGFGPQTSEAMNINRHNYEEFFILYTDNELSNEDRRQVELFVNENPDLKAELDLFLQGRLIPDTAVAYTDKEQLMRSSIDTGFIDLSNYEEWLLSYVDNELPDNQKIAVEKFVSHHAGVKAELDYLQKTKLQTDTSIVFANKEILYRREEKVRVIGISWKRIAIAATLILAVSAAAFITFNNQEENHAGIASNPDKIKPEQNNSTGAIQQPVEEISSTNTKAAGGTITEIEKDMGENDKVAAKKKIVEPQQKIIPDVSPSIKENEPVLADNTIEKKNGTNNLPQPTSNPYVIKPITGNPIAMTEPPVNETALTNPKETNGIATVTPDNSQPLDNMITVANQEPTKKNKLRGFFRKVARTFEKNTNIKATDDEDRLLLGGLAIQL